MLELFDTKYKAVSNFYVHTYEDKRYTYPSPFYLHATIEDEGKNLKNRLEIKTESYNQSILVVDYYFDLFFYLLSFEYKIHTVYIRNCVKEESSQDVHGHKGIYKFLNNDVLLNIGLEEIYDEYTKTKTRIPNSSGN